MYLAQGYLYQRRPPGRFVKMPKRGKRGDYRGETSVNFEGSVPRTKNSGKNFRRRWGRRGLCRLPPGHGGGSTDAGTVSGWAGPERSGGGPGRRQAEHGAVLGRRRPGWERRGGGLHASWMGAAAEISGAAASRRPL